MFNALSILASAIPAAFLVIAISVSASAQAKDNIRARDLGIPFAGTTGPLNAITDVTGLEVGQVTVIKGKGTLDVGKGPIRTGVTAILPRGKNSTSPVFGGWFTLNGSGEMTGTTWIEERGVIDGPILITNTHSVGVVRDAAVSWMVDKGWAADWHAPVVAETYDGGLNDINGFHVTKAHALDALGKAKGGKVVEGVVGGGTGMICNGFKGGIGTASRQYQVGSQSYTLGVLVQCNYNWSRNDLTIAGKEVGKRLKADPNCFTDSRINRHFGDYWPYCDSLTVSSTQPDYARDGSIIIIIATDAPLLPHQLRRVAKRPSLALGRLGTVSNAGSGDIFLAFSTAANEQLSENKISNIAMFPNNHLSTVFRATVDATEEAIINAMVAADTVIGINGLKLVAIPNNELEALMLEK
ncbi:MAG: Beta-peptidyl aminopeptidase BapA [Porticoccaceae bacterium UBA1117]|nr:MAG: Beta-peptidyl aminopeptidase BapA [Porticoccaceae bacterium UBA1117]|tara:strand:+ start:8313 stop:9548 length:1236 start_codon:yes stop_codon:yes gene_type:complete